MKTYDIINLIESIAPESQAESWDNPGLLVGDNREINKILLAVDASDYVIDTGIEQGVDMIITHHPLIFSGLKKVNDRDFIGRRVLKLAKNNIALVAAHTNFDICQMNDAVSKRLGLNMEGQIDEHGFGCYGSLINENIKTVEELTKLVKNNFEINSLRVFGDLYKKIDKLGIFPGSGRSAIDKAVELNLDVLITGDIDHHSGIDAVSKGMCIIDPGHYGIEKVFVDYMADYLNNELESIELICVKDDDAFITL